MASGREWRGGQNQVRLLARELAGIPELQQRLVTKQESELARRAGADGVAVVGSPWGPGLDPRALWRVWRALTTWSPHVLHAHDSHALTLASWARRLARRYTPPPVLVATRRVDFHVRRRSAWQRADRLIAISDAVKRILVTDGIPERVVTVIPSGIDPEEVRRAGARPLDIRGRLGLAPGTPLAVNVAALVPHKDQLTLVRAAQAARAARPELHWAVAGSGALRPSLAAEITRLGLADRVHLLGYIDDADALIREGDVFVMSSREEGLGSVVLHALALDRPVVATRGGGLPEIVPPDWLVPVGDADGLARKVLAALDHPAPVPLPARCTAAVMARAVLALYRTLL